MTIRDQLDDGIHIKPLIDKTCKETGWVTPPRILDPVHAYAELVTGRGIFLDPATDGTNPCRAHNFFTEADDGLKHSWREFGGRNDCVFVNPPYGEVFKMWVAKIAKEAELGCQNLVVLFPANRLETEYIQRVWTHRLTAVCWVRRRVAFLKRDGTAYPGNPYGSALYLFNGNYLAFAEAFKEVGLCFVPTILPRES